MGVIADRVRQMRGRSLADIVTEIERMEAGELFALEPVEAGPDIEREFAEQFWPAYPHKTGKPVALRAFIKARKKDSLDAIMRGLFDYIAAKPADRPWLNPSTFLNQARYFDQPAATFKTGNTSELRNDLRSRIADRQGRQGVADPGPVRYLPHR